MAAAANILDWGPNIDFHIYNDNYRTDLMSKMRRIVGINTQTEFTERNGKEYFSVTLVNWEDKGLVCQMVRDNLFVTGMGPRGGLIFRFNDFDDFGEGARNLGFKGNYNSLTRGLESTIYTISYEKFRQSVEFLIGEMYSGKNLDDLDTYKWQNSMFTIIMALGEGGRNHIISNSYEWSRLNNRPSKIPGPWINCVILNWSAFTKSAIEWDDQSITFQDLTADEKKMLYAIGVAPDSYRQHLEDVKGNARVCRAMLAILCNHLTLTHE